MGPLHSATWLGTTGTQRTFKTAHCWCH